jgi:hypothetical protein
MRVASKWLISIAILVMMISAALADTVDDLIAKLKDSNSKVRLSAALNLGKLTEAASRKRAVLPLVDTLKDGDKTVRGVAAAALGKIVDDTIPARERNAAIDALERMAQDDNDSFAKGQASKAFATVKTYRTTGGGTPAKVAVYVEIGPFADKTPKPDPKLLPLARKKVDEGIAKVFATKWPTGKSPSKAEIAKAGAKAFYVDGTLTITEAKVGSGVKVECRIAMLVATYPDKSVFGMLDPARNKAALEVDPGDVALAREECVKALAGDMVAKQVVPLIKTK